MFLDSSNKHYFVLLIDLCYIVAELMILGFISLILVFSQYYIAKICIPVKVADTMLPCPAHNAAKKGEEHRRRLLWYERRVLAAGAQPTCGEVIGLQFLLPLPFFFFFSASSKQ